MAWFAGSIALLILASLWIRVLNLRSRQWQARELPTDPIPSLFSRALTQLIGVAGGIYLVLVMGTSFLKLSVPAEVHWFGLSVEPLAFISLLLALIQPFLERLQLRQ
ncbi:MAG: hypothetical protein ACPLPT_01950 [Moorellales bacterium]